jgi:4'-phosphopantetheinyl transferase
MPFINCGNIKIEKAANLSAIQPAPAAIYIFPLQLQQSQFLIDNYWGVLSEAERQRASAYKQSIISQRYSIGRIALRMIVGACTQINPAAVCFTENPGQKPIIANVPGAALHFSISYSSHYCLLAIANEPIGIDLEFVDSSKLDQELVNRFFCSEELKHIEQSDNPLENIFIYWTRKEALLKATGKGIGDWLPETQVLDGKHWTESAVIGSANSWQLNDFRLTENYIGTIAHSNFPGAINFRSIQDYL